MSRGRFVTIGGMWYPITETPAGMPAATARLKALGFDTGASPYTHDARQAIYEFLRGAAPGEFIGLMGDSLGAGAAALYAGDQKRATNFAGGYQPSNYDPIGTEENLPGQGEKHVIVVPANVLVAWCVYDPVVWDTLGLGNAEYVLTPGAKTKLIEITHRGAHPDDWGWSQDQCFATLERLLKAA